MSKWQKSLHISNHFKCKWLNSSSKRQRLAGLITHDPTICLPPETHIRDKDIDWKSKGGKDCVQILTKRAEVATLKSDKTDFK